MTKISPCLGMQNYAWKRIGFQVSTYQKTGVGGYEGSRKTMPSNG